MAGVLRPILRPVRPLRPLTRAITEAGVGVFNPVSLFAANEPGYIYDNNDLTSFFADSAGTTAASVNGPVGLQLDWSRGLVRGPERLTNGDFAAGSAGWSTSGTDGTHIITFAGGAVRYQSDTVSPQLTLSQAGVLVAGRWYEITTVCSAHVSGSVRVPSTASSAAVIADGVGTKTIKVLATGTSLDIIRHTANVDLTIDSISVKEISGNHRYQLTAASRPTLRGTPTGLTLVTNGDFAAGLTGWTNPDTAPGTTTAAGGGALMNNNTTGTARLRQQVTVVNGGYYRVRFTVSGFTGATNTGSLSLGNAGSGDTAYGTVLIAANGTFERWIGPMTTTTLGLAFIIINVAACSFTIDNVEVHNVSAGSVTAPYGLQYDGVDDFLQTASVNFTATDAVNVCMGVRKLSDAAVGMVVEFGTDSGSVNGTFALYGPSVAAAATFRAASRGTATSLVTTTATLSAPVTAVPTAQFDISADTNSIRINGAANNTASTDQGAGNYGNLPFYFGRRAGTSLPFNGLEFGGVCIGRTLTALELANVERWTGQRTGVTIP